VWVPSGVPPRRENVVVTPEHVNALGACPWRAPLAKRPETRTRELCRDEARSAGKVPRRRFSMVSAVPPNGDQMRSWLLRFGLTPADPYRSSGVVMSWAPHGVGLLQGGLIDGGDVRHLSTLVV